MKSETRNELSAPHTSSAMHAGAVVAQLAAEGSWVVYRSLDKVNNLGPGTDAAFAAANARRCEILRLLPQLTAELKRLDSFIDTWCDMMGVSQPRRPANVSRVGPRTRNMPREEVVDLCLSILTESGRPMMGVDLLAALGDRGVEIYGKRPAMVLSTMLWRSQDKIIRTRIGYIPASAIEARRAETQSGSVEDESAVAKPDAQERSA